MARILKFFGYLGSGTIILATSYVLGKYIHAYKTHINIHNKIRNMAIKSDCELDKQLLKYDSPEYIFTDSIFENNLTAIFISGEDNNAIENNFFIDCNCHIKKNNQCVLPEFFLTKNKSLSSCVL